MTCIFQAACFESVVLAVAAAVDSLCMSLCGCLCVLLFAPSTKAAPLCANLHRTTTQPTCLQYDFTIMRESFIAVRRPNLVECTGTLPTSEVKRRRARLILGWGTAQEDQSAASVFAFAFSLPVCVYLCVCVNSCADDSYISFCLFSTCLFGGCCGCGQSLHFSVWLFVCFAVCTEQQSRTYVCQCA